MQKKRWIILIFLTGFSILVYPHVAQWVNGYLQKKHVHQFQHEINQLSEDELDKLMIKAQECNEEVYYDSQGFRDPFGDNQEKLQAFQSCLNIEDGTMFGAVEIPKLKLVIPIYLGSSDDILNKGIGQVEGSSLPIGGQSTHTVLAGHRGMGTKAMFRNVDELKEGDVFYIHTMGELLTYQVYEQQVIYPSETDSLEIVEGKDLATLLTCHPYRHNHQRLLVFGERVNETEVSID